MGQPIDQNRNIGLDIIRATAILMVLTSHSWLIFIAGRYYLSIFGVIGVELFFILSGFLLGSILFKEFAIAPFSFKTLKIFWIRRWFRTLPLYFIFLLFNICVTNVIFETKVWNWKYFFFLQNFVGPHPSMMIEAWSLSVEEWFYLSFPLILFSFLRFFKDKRRGFLWLTVGYICLFTGLRIYFAFEEGLNWDSQIRHIVMLRLDAIGYGVLAAYMLTRYKERIETLQNKFFLFGLGLGLGAICFYFYCKSAGMLNSAYFKILLFPLLSFSAIFILYKCIWVDIKIPLIKTLIVKMSLYSYSAYLVHMAIVVPTFQSFEIFKKEPIITYTIYVIVVFVISHFTFRFIEQPFLKIRDTFFKYHTREKA